MAILASILLTRSSHGTGLLALLFAILLLPLPLSAQRSESDLKAAFVFNFSQFTDFPTNSFAATNSPFSLMILGDNPFGNTLAELVRGEHVRGHPIELRVTRNIADITNAHLVYISRPFNERWAQLLPSFRGRPILTVSDADGFARAGGMIRLFSEGGRVRFNINPAVAREAGLGFHSKLLRLATIVGPDAASE